MRDSLTVFNASPLWNLMGNFDEFFEPRLRQPSTSGSGISYEVTETDDGLVLGVDLPGVNKEDVKIEIADQVLTLSGQRRRAGKQEPQKFFARFTLPADADGARAEARLENGILELAVPKLESTKPRTIEVQSSAKTGLFAKLLSKSEEKKVGETQ